MGGGGRYPYPKYVWSPSGGWWSQPKNWRTNTAVAFVGMLGACAWITSWIDRNRERTDTSPPRARAPMLPSQSQFH